jgi:hypothetical protein
VTFTKPPRHRYSCLRRTPFALFFHAKRAISFALGFHHARFAELSGFSLFLEDPLDSITAQKSVKFKT